MNSFVPKISVVMAVHDGQEHVRQAIESLLSQKFTVFELVVIDDFSTDKTCEILKDLAIKDSRIKLFRNKNNIGLTKSLNKGIGLSKGRYIARLDHDDIALPERLHRQYEFLEANPGVFLCGSRVSYIDKNGNRIEMGNEFVSEPEDIKNILPRRNCLVHSSIMFRNQGFTYRDKFYYSQDYDFYLMLLSAGKNIANVDEELVLFRRAADSISFLSKSKQQKFAGLARKFYQQRISEGQDGYDQFDPKKIMVDNNSIEGKEALFEMKVVDYLKNGKFAEARKLLRSQLKASKFFFPAKHLSLLVFSWCPFSYKCYRLIKYGGK